MRRRKTWLAYSAILTGFIVVGLLIFTLNRGPWARGFEPFEGKITLSDFCLWCEGDQDVTPTDILGIVLIGLAALALPAGHIALLIALASHLSRPPKFSDLEPAFRCPHCAHPLVKQWRVCPYCGERIREHETSQPPRGGKRIEERGKG